MSTQCHTTYDHCWGALRRRLTWNWHFTNSLISTVFHFHFHISKKKLGHTFLIHDNPKSSWCAEVCIHNPNVGDRRCDESWVGVTVQGPNSNTRQLARKSLTQFPLCDFGRNHSDNLGVAKWVRLVEKIITKPNEFKTPFVCDMLWNQNSRREPSLGSHLHESEYEPLPNPRDKSTVKSPPARRFRSKISNLPE